MEANNPSPGDYPHYLLRGAASSEGYTPPSGFPSSDRKKRDRQRHGEKLNQELDQARRQDQDRKEDADPGMNVDNGIYIQFESDPGYELKIDSLERKRQGIEVVAVKDDAVEIEGDTRIKQAATVYVPEGKLSHFFDLIERYLTEDTPSGNPRYHSLVDTIAQIRLATLEALWTEPGSEFPDPNEMIWWEAWLRKGENDDGLGKLVDKFQEQAKRAELETSDNLLTFPENTVLLIQGSPEELSKSVLLLDCLSEIRKAKTAAEFFLNLSEMEQTEAAEETLERTTFPDRNAPAVCLLDSGLNRGHPMLSQAASPNDMDAYDPDWGTNDDGAHGTLMAGLCLYGDMAGVLVSNAPVNLEHRIESVKILPPNGANDPQLYGEITRESIARAEVNSPFRSRVFCMAVTSDETRDQGRPSSWSGAVDKAAYGSGPDSPDKRLVLVSAGNTHLQYETDYPDQNEADGIHDPAQSWNAITVGAYTDKTTIDPDKYPDFRPIASKGSLSPRSTSSLIWDNQWPIKPDIVMEGGNMTADSTGTALDGPDSLRLVTTNDQYQNRGLFAPMGDTSASAALASRMGAQIIQNYPDLWPETVRALIVHSAEWTPQMISEVSGDSSGSNDMWDLQRQQKENLMRKYGHGIPNITSALRNAKNAVTLVSEDKIQPFGRSDSGNVTSKDLNLHSLPWPKQVLQDLGGTKTKMRVTLSYFIEPNPGRKGYQDQRSYASARLRFKVKSPTETIDEFRARINQAARDENYESGDNRDYSNWMLGPMLRTKGSVHADTWHGTAAELAEKEKIAVYPVSGWWKYRSFLERWKNSIRYSLVASISTQEQDVDIYNQIRIPESIKVSN